jgi:hypothetical protein
MKFVFVVLLSCTIVGLSSVSAFTAIAPFVPTQIQRVVVGAGGFQSTVSNNFNTPPTSTQLAAAASNNGGGGEFFKAGLLANVEDEAGRLASKTIRSVADLGWKSKVAKRRGNTRPRHWAFGGAGEKAIQDKPNYDPTNPLCVESWLSLQDFYAIVKDDTAVADTIFVALAKGGAYIERDVAEDVIAQWRPTTTGGNPAAGSGGPMFGRTKGVSGFDQGAFVKTVQEGRFDFVKGWAAFVTITGVAVAGIVFPTNPLQLALVDFLETLTHTDERMAVLAASKAAAL